MSTARRMLAVAVAALVLAGCTSGADPDGPRSPGPAASASGRTRDPAAPDEEACARPCRARPRGAGRFGEGVAPEASGLAASRRNRGLLYVVDDGPGTTSLAVIRERNGRLLGRLEVTGLDGTDTEDLAVGRCSAAARDWCIYVADIGDNRESRETIEITRIPEPDLRSDIPDAVAGEVAVLRYPDGAHDAEAFMVSRDGGLAIVTKDARNNGANAGHLYVTGGFSDATLRDAGRVKVPRPRAPFVSVVLGNVVTAADFTPGLVALRTYDAIFEYVAPRRTSSLAGFRRWPVREVASPIENQGEALAYGSDGCSLYTVSEGSDRLSVVPCR